ncbi:MAG: NAD(P)H-dependent oxidoreductase, partial [Arenicella sp.]|nr:NAD(P)H-dependent oxidoreductase [Arenicella sp.]
NKQLVRYVAGMVPDSEVELIDLNDYELPLFCEDLEREIGKPQAAADFLAKLGSGNAIIVSFAEHNGNYSAAFKNLFDWCTRQAGRDVYQNKPMLLLATSNGGRGGKSVLELATNASPRFGGDVRASISVPSFSENFDVERARVSNAEINQQLADAVKALIS